MSNPLVERTYQTDEGKLTVHISQPRQDGSDWFCDVTATGTEETHLSIGGIDAWQSLRLAIQTADAIINTHRGTTYNGIAGAV